MNRELALAIVADSDFQSAWLSYLRKPMACTDKEFRLSQSFSEAITFLSEQQ